MNRPISMLQIALAGLAFAASQLSAQESEYQLGRGFHLSDVVTVGGYFSTEYAVADDKNEFVLDDLAIMAYGDLSNRLSFLVEIESIDAYRNDFETDTTTTNFPPTIERLYGDYKFSDNLAVRFGKQITPIGYWNLQPINVLRETTSNPRYSRDLFPKFLTGVDVYGFTPFDDALTYHVYLQNGGDMDDNNINIKVDSHYGVALERELGSGWKAGGSAGRFTTRDAMQLQTRSRYFQLNSRYDNFRYSIISEGMVNSIDAPGRASVRSSSIYLQGEYRFTPKHALISRVEHFRDSLLDKRERIGVIGYSFRPVYPVSFKLEYQWHADTNENQFLSSISILF